MFDKSLLSFADKLTIRTNNFVSSLSLVAKTQCFFHIGNSNLQLISGISSDLQKLPNYFNDTAIIEFSKITFAAACASL